MENANSFEDISKVYIQGTRTLSEKYLNFVNSLDDDFYKSFYEKLIETFPYLKDGGEYGDWCSSTVGWYYALTDVIGEDKYNEFYSDLEWYDSDFLDGEIESRLDRWFNKNRGNK